MIDLSKKRVLVIDHGVFCEFAFRLARDFGKVYYWTPWESAFSKIDQAAIGIGFDEIERVNEPWGLLDRNEVDLVVFPDVHHAEMQRHIESLGFRVWGARSADALELHKWRFKKIQDDLGMPHAKFDTLEGLQELREYCFDPQNKDRWIKISPQFRGTRETKHHIDYKSSQQWLDALGAELDGLAEVLTFLAEHPLEAPFEGGMDTYCVDGQLPQTVVQGYERKDKGYFAVVQPYSDVPKEISSAIEPLLPLLKQRRCRQMLSTEVKITEDKKSYLLEPTIRQPSPAGEEQFELYENFSEIIWEGAQGTLVEPEVAFKFACEAMIAHDGDDQCWRSLEIPDSERKWIKIYNLAKVEGRYLTAPGCEVIGAVVGVGNTPDEALDHLKENAETLKDQPVTIHVEALASIISEIEEAQEKGLHFTEQAMPEPAAAVE